ncbi:MAG: hypothetical protein QF893_10490 [Alphaproteobacteria bacterium]|nr:hypothetical protein [Alphaproteobacteria bacterium]
MTLIVWSDDFSVGVEALDRDHIIIFSLINHIHEACQCGTDRAAFAADIVELPTHWLESHILNDDMAYKPVLAAGDGEAG